MELKTIDDLHTLVYRIECGNAILVALRDALQAAALDLDAYVLALNGAYDYLSTLTEELHDKLETVTVTKAETAE